MFASIMSRLFNSFGVKKMIKFTPKLVVDSYLKKQWNISKVPSQSASHTHRSSGRAEAAGQAGSLTNNLLPFCVCYLHMQMQTLCRAVEISITTSYSTSVKMFYRGLTKVFIASPFCDEVHERQVKRNHLSWICREPRWMSSLNRELS